MDFSDRKDKDEIYKQLNLNRYKKTKSITLSDVVMIGYVKSQYKKTNSVKSKTLKKKCIKKTYSSN